MTCRYCFDEEWPVLLLRDVCACKGTCGPVHIHCLLRWIMRSAQVTCGVCGDVYFCSDETARRLFHVGTLCKNIVTMCVYTVDTLAERLS